MPIGPLVDNPEPYGFQPKQQQRGFGLFGRFNNPDNPRTLAHNEYIVYKEDQVALRYIVQYR